MGNKLNCFSKQKQQEDRSTSSERKPLELKHKKIINNVAVEVENQPPCQTENEIIQPLTSNVQHSPAQSQITLLPLAPANYKPPEPLSSTKQSLAHDVKPSLDRSKYSKHKDIQKPQESDAYALQTVDPTARSLARNGSKPACWTDLHWSLIGQRELKTDEEKLRALFSWLCSLSVGEKPFYTYEELEQAVQAGVPFAKEALALKSKQLKQDSPEHVLNEMAQNRASYLQSFEALCQYSHIPCVKVHGIAKGVDYLVGMPLSDEQNPNSATLNKLQHVWNAAYMDGKWALFDPIWAAQRLAANARTTNPDVAQNRQMEYQMDMFYFNADPAKYIYSHFPTDPAWQLLSPPMSLKQFESSVLLKPAFFRHGLGLLSHQECVIPASNKLVVKLAIPKTYISTLQFTFNLKYDGKDESMDASNLPRLGIHELSKKDGVIIFHFRFPKPGAYNLTLYAQNYGEKLFSDICEYRVESRPTTDLQQVNGGSQTPNQTISIPPFPPTSQAHYGVAEKGVELGLVTIPPNLENKLKCKSGVIEVKFTVDDKKRKLPHLTARLKSLLHETTVLTDCLIFRNIIAPISTSITSIQDCRSSVEQMSIMFEQIIITAFLPTAGEYALEVYGAPADSEDNTSYYLVWQFLIDSDIGFELSSPLRDRLATMTLGPQDETWKQLNIQLVSHSDPFIRVPTRGTLGKQSPRSKSEIMQQYMMRTTEHREIDLSVLVNTDSNDITDKGDNLNLTASSETPDLETQQAIPDPNECDLKIMFRVQNKNNVHIVGQLIDVSTEEEQDCTLYLLQKWEPADEIATLDTLCYLIRIPKGDHFYKFYLYATMVNKNELPKSLPLVFTYLIQAPARLMAAELPYIGVKFGAFPEKLQKQTSKSN